MRCPKCKSDQITVIDSRVKHNRAVNYVGRRRKCLTCDYRWNTIEITEEDYSFMFEILMKAKGILWNQLRW